MVIWYKSYKIWLVKSSTYVIPHTFPVYITSPVFSNKLLIKLTSFSTNQVNILKRSIISFMSIHLNFQNPNWLTKHGIITCATIITTDILMVIKPSDTPHAYNSYFSTRSVGAKFPLFKLNSDRISLTEMDAVTHALILISPLRLHITSMQPLCQSEALNFAGLKCKFWQGAFHYVTFPIQLMGRLLNATVKWWAYSLNGRVLSRFGLVLPTVCIWYCVLWSLMILHGTISIISARVSWGHLLYKSWT